MKKLVSVFVFLSGFISVSAFADNFDFPHLSTTGYGEVTAKPDMAEFSVRVVETALTAEQAKQSVDKVVDTFLSGLKKEGVKSENIQSSNLYLAPQYHYPKDGKPELTGYRANRTVNVTVMELAKLNGYLDLALRDGINQVNNIQLKVKDEAKFKRQARMEAIKDANRKAKSLAKGFGLELGKVWQIDYNAPNTQPVVMRAMALDVRKESNSYQDSSLVIHDNVEVVYKLKN
ncbi:oxidative stress defense protein [Vibrio sp. S4M6]|uniref:oxidative stress defense protein n=1 Tax=Vibrio sinus TaxID=2946865 RepID=UPI00202AAD11|nr:oxidative stress defense protein [Vibrio sinus]MCL9780912.1 oxidative stress defense protein [Vibrio sinus]